MPARDYLELRDICRRANLDLASGRRILIESGIPARLIHFHPLLTAQNAARLLPLLKSAAVAKRAAHRPAVLLPGFECAYFISDGDYVKIGAALDASKRLADLQVANPRKLTLLFVRDGGFTEEARLHEQFAEHHERGDWFRIEGSLAAFIEGQMRNRDTQSHANPTHSGLNAHLADMIRYVSS